MYMLWKPYPHIYIMHTSHMRIRADTHTHTHSGDGLVRCCVLTVWKTVPRVHCKCKTQTHLHTHTQTYTTWQCFKNTHGIVWLGHTRLHHIFPTDILQLQKDHQFIPTPRFIYLPFVHALHIPLFAKLLNTSNQGGQSLPLCHHPLLSRLKTVFSLCLWQRALSHIPVGIPLIN